MSFGAHLALAASLALPPFMASACVTGQTMIFFDSGSSDISPGQAERLDAFAVQLQQFGIGSRVSILGFADRRGSVSANLALSRRRAESVRSYLAARGVPDGVIDTMGAGEGHPLLPTVDGTGEPQNRRVVVTEVVDPQEAVRRRSEQQASGMPIPIC